MDSAPSGRALAEELALRLHRQDGIELRIDVPAGAVLTVADLPDGCQLVEEGVVQFNSLATRNDIVAMAAFAGFQFSSELLAKHEFDKWCAAT